MKYIHTSYKKFNESKINVVTAYHGSPYKFDNFKREKKSMQLGADLGYWFTTNKKLAEQFANIYPDTMYDEIKKTETTYSLKITSEKTEAIKHFKFNLIKDYLSSNDELKNFIYDLITIEQSKDVAKFDNFIKGLFSFYGKRNIPTNIMEIFNEYILIESKYKIYIDDTVALIKDKYDKEHKGYLYTVELKIGKQAIVNGEDIGVNWGRHGSLLQYEAEEYDSVLIKNADTGQGFGDEIVVFDLKNITIKKKEEV